MSAFENKQIVLDAYAALNAGDPAGYLARLSDDVVATYYAASGWRELIEASRTSSLISFRGCSSIWTAASSSP